MADKLMRAMIALRDRAVSSVKFYKVSWKSFSPAGIDKVRFDTGSVYKKPENYSIAAYGRSGKITFQVHGMTRPDLLAWYTNEIIDEFVPSIKSPQDEYLRVGWAFSDMNAKYFHLADVRRETRDLNGRAEDLQINSYKSQPSADDQSCAYEQYYARDNKLIGSVEDCGRYGKVGYFDYDRVGKMQYRVKYKQETEPTAAAGTVTTAPAATTR
jgi:hypothetical protein